MTRTKADETVDYACPISHLLFFFLVGVEDALIVEDNAEAAEVKFRFRYSLSGADHRDSFSKALTHFTLSKLLGLEDEERNFFRSLVPREQVGRCLQSRLCLCVSCWQ